MQTSTWLCSRELAEAAGDWNTEMLSDDDGEYFSRVLMASEGVRFVERGLVYYRDTGAGSLSHLGFNPKKVEAQWRSMQLNIKYLRSIEESERVRAACVRYLSTWSYIFYPNHIELARKANQLAHELGGTLEEPGFSWKYAWIKRFFGWRLARAAQTQVPIIKHCITRNWDKMLYTLENARDPANDLAGLL